MKVLHLASVNRWTGAAAPAFAETEALREAGVEAFFGYSGGYKLEAKLRDCAFAFPAILDDQDPVSFVRSVRHVRRLIRELRPDVVHAHLTHDHVIALAASARLGSRVVRTFHARRALRSDPLTRLLLRRTAAVAVVNEALRNVLRDGSPHVTPPPLKLEQFRPDGPSARTRYGLAAHEVVIGAIGKLAPKRGFEEVLRTFAALHHRGDAARLVVVGEGPHTVRLTLLAQELGIEGAVIWAGYHEEALAEHYRAMSVLLFTAAGSDEGHRAILEALGCGTSVAAYPLPGVQALLAGAPDGWLASSPSPEHLAAAVARILAQPEAQRREAAARAAERFGYAHAAERLQTLYADAMEAPELA